MGNQLSSPPPPSANRRRIRAFSAADRFFLLPRSINSKPILSNISFIKIKGPIEQVTENRLCHALLFLAKKYLFLRTVPLFLSDGSGGFFEELLDIGFDKIKETIIIPKSNGGGDWKKAFEEQVNSLDFDYSSPRGVLPYKLFFLPSPDKVPLFLLPFMLFTLFLFYFDNDFQKERDSAVLFPFITSF